MDHWRLSTKKKELKNTRKWKQKHNNPTLCDAAKAVLNGSLQCYKLISGKENPQINKSILGHLKELEKENK